MDKILTIIVPSYNMEAYLPRCLGSLVVDDKELLQRLDVIVVNDGSKDRTSEIAHEFESKYPDVFRVIDKANGHYGSCINAALPLVTGEYVKVLDADDLFDKTTFSDYLRFINRYANTGERPDIIVNDYRFINVTGRVGGAWKGSHEFSLPEEGMFGEEEIKRNPNLQQNTVLAYRTGLLKNIGYRQTEGICYTDWEWVSVPFVFVHSGVYFHRVLYLYLMGREGQSMDTKTWMRNMWMRRDLVFIMLDRVYGFKKKGLMYQAEELRNHTYNMVRGIYRDCIFSSVRSSLESNLKLMDVELQKKDEGLYKRLADELYSPRVRYKYVKAWRTKAVSLWAMVLLCRLYSRIVELRNF